MRKLITTLTLAFPVVPRDGNNYSQIARFDPKYTRYGDPDMT